MSSQPLALLIDIGNTRTHLGLGDSRSLKRTWNLPTADWLKGEGQRNLLRALGRRRPSEVILASVVPRATSVVRGVVRRQLAVPCREFKAATLRGLAIDYPRPETIGADRLAGALAARALLGQPVLAIDFGTATTFNVVDGRGCFIGGVIAPGLAVMTAYLPEKTALLPSIKWREIDRVIGRSTTEAIRAGVVGGYRGLVSALIAEIRGELRCRRLPVVATGGNAARVAGQVPEIGRVCPHLTLEGLRRDWLERLPSR